MKPTPFDPASDLAPIPFDRRHLDAAAALKEAGLEWRPHVGCFVWDRDEWIEVRSPFPSRVYFILNLGHFLRRFETVERIAERLIWVPTWNQARRLRESLVPSAPALIESPDGLLTLYGEIEAALETRSRRAVQGSRATSSNMPAISSDGRVE